MRREMIPDKIYLPWEYAETDVLPPGVTTKQVFGKDVCFIRKDSILEWANEQKKDEMQNFPYILDMLIDKLNSL